MINSNCPKYINVRTFEGHPSTNPSIALQSLHLEPTERLPDEVVDLITSSDTVHIASKYVSEASTAAEFPSHAGMNSRGGLPGFIRVMPSDGRTVILPDYSGNKMLTSLGNIESTGLGALTFVSYTTGDVLYLTGTGRVLIGPPALEIMVRQASILALEVTGYTLVHDAFPVRQKQGTEVERSPYSPKVKYLVDEPAALAGGGGGQKAKVVSGRQLAEDLAVFRFEVLTKPGAAGLKIRPGQAVVLDFMDWIGPPQYRHMADDSPQSINDDRVRTWTVSSAHEDQDAAWFEMTMREMKGGAVTGALFDLLRKQPHNTWGQCTAIDGDIVMEVVGVTGDFFIKPGAVNLLLVAGGIGLTPFLSMLSALAGRGSSVEGEVTLTLSAREADVFMDLIRQVLAKISPSVRMRIDLFTKMKNFDADGLANGDNCRVVVHEGRIPATYWADVADGDKDVFICGPGGFGDAAMEGLRALDVPLDRIHREGFY